MVEQLVVEALQVGLGELGTFDLHRPTNLLENRPMCYSDDARPPLPPISGAAADQGDMTLKAADGNEFMAYFARSSKPTGAGMIVMPDVRGLHHFYKELAQRFAVILISGIPRLEAHAGPDPARSWPAVTRVVGDRRSTHNRQRPSSALELA